jgi:hypothetical protein
MTQQDTDTNRFQLERIANALEEILRLVKKDQEESKKRWEDADKE